MIGYTIWTAIIVGWCALFAAVCWAGCLAWLHEMGARRWLLVAGCVVLALLMLGQSLAVTERHLRNDGTCVEYGERYNPATKSVMPYCKVRVVTQ